MIDIPKTEEKVSFTTVCFCFWALSGLISERPLDRDAGCDLYCESRMSLRRVFELYAMPAQPRHTFTHRLVPSETILGNPTFLPRVIYSVIKTTAQDIGHCTQILSFSARPKGSEHLRSSKAL